MNLDTKTQLIGKLSDAIFELKLRVGSGTLIQTQRLFGFVLGMRIAVFISHDYSWDFPHSKFLDQILYDDFGGMTLKEIRGYAFPEDTANYKKEKEVFSVNATRRI